MAKNSLFRTIKFLKSRPDSKRNKGYEKLLESATIYKVSRKIWGKILKSNTLSQMEDFELPGDNFVIDFYPSVNIGKGLGVEFIHFMRYSDKTRYDFPSKEEHSNSFEFLCDDVSIRICFRRGSFFPVVVKMAIKNGGLYSHRRKHGWDRLMNFEQEQDGDYISPFIILGIQCLYVLSEQSKL